jgi:hypothetical protein
LRRSRIGVIGCVVLMAMATVARADFAVSGTFGPDTQGVSGLAGGSYDGTFSVHGLPASNGGSITLDSFTLNLKDAGGTTVETLTNTAGDLGGVYGNFNFSGLDELLFIKSGGGSGLELGFAMPFNGAGSIIGDRSLGFVYNGPSLTLVDVASGSSRVRSVPEPSSLWLSGSAVALCHVFGRRRGKAKLVA